MSIICRIRNEPWVHDLCASDHEARQRIRAHDWFSTLFDEVLVQGIWNRARNQGAPSPLLDLSGRFRVDYVASRKEGAKRCAHVRLPKGEGGSGGGRQMSQEHEAVQLMLLRLGRRFGERPQLEYRFPDGQRGDVVWLKSEVCWEVDLSVRSQREQERREIARRQAGFRMVALVDSRSKAATHADMERVRLWRLREQALKAMTDRRAGLGWLETTFVDNVLTWVEGGWQKRSRVGFADFAASLVAGCMSYEPPTLGRRRYAWIAEADFRAAAEQLHIVSANGGPATEPAFERDQPTRATSSSHVELQQPPLVTPSARLPVLRGPRRRSRPRPPTRPRPLRLIPKVGASGGTPIAGQAHNPKTQAAVHVSVPQSVAVPSPEGSVEATPAAPPRSLQRTGARPMSVAADSPPAVVAVERDSGARERNSAVDPVPRTQEFSAIGAEQTASVSQEPLPETPGLSQEPLRGPAKGASVAPRSAAKIEVLRSMGWDQRQQRKAMLTLVARLPPSPRRAALIAALLRANHWTTFFDWLGRRRQQVARAHAALLASLPAR